MPGPFIKFFQNSLGNKGLYNILDAYSDKSATAVCTLAFVPQVHGDPVVFQGIIEGRLVSPDDPEFHGKSKEQGFGWDSIFIPEGYEVPFSEMSLEEKCKISHRGEAVRQWVKFMELNEVRRSGERREEFHIGEDMAIAGRVMEAMEKTVSKMVKSTLNFFNELSS